MSTEANPPAPLPLEGVRVLELTHAVLGPTAGLILADLGADVIKLEPPPRGDPTRYLSGFGMGFFPYLNRNKRSLVLDLKREAGKEVMHRLLDGADVLIENFAPGTIDRLGFGYDALAKRYPRLVFCSLKGFLPGPYEQRVALDEVVQMMSGLAYMTGPPGQPLRAGASVIDIMTGIYGAMGVITALAERERSGQGQLVRSALFETAAFLMGQHLAYAIASGQKLPPMPARVSAWAIYHQFRTADDKLLFLGVTSDKQWPRFCRAFDRQDLLDDPRLATNNDRVREQSWLLPDLREMLAGMTLAEAVRRCEQAHLPFSPVAHPEDLFDDPQLQQGDSLFDIAFPNGKHGPLPRQPLLLGERRGELRRQPPQVGQDSRAILAELGYDERAVADLEADGVVIAAPTEAPTHPPQEEADA